jgi:hypothetical protein
LYGGLYERAYIIRYFPLAERECITPGDGQINHDDFYVPDADAGRQRKNQGPTDMGVQGARLDPLGLFLRMSTPFMWRILSAFLRA